MNRKQRRAAAKQPSGSAHAQFVDEGLRHHHAGRLDRARALYVKGLALQPNDANALHLLGMLRQQQGSSLEAVELIAKAIAIQPDIAEWHSNLGVALAALGRCDEAVVAYRRAVAIRSEYPEGHYNLGVALAALGRFDEASDAYRRAIVVRPDYAEAYNNLGSALAAIGKTDEAVAAYRRAVVLKPDNMGAHNNLGKALARLRKIEEAIGAYRRAITIRSDVAEPHYGLSECLLLIGDLQQGFQEYRWRWKQPNSGRMPAVSCPLWEGESLSGKAILVHCEQGYGDSLQFIRYVAPLSRMAERVAVLADQALASLFRSIPGIEVLTTPGDEHDYHIPLMCLPRLFKTTLDTIPADVPYLSADPKKAARWAERLSGYEGRIKVGLVWAGSSRKHDLEANAIDRRRSMTLQQIAPLARIANIQFFSLQKGEPSSQALHPPNGMQLVDMTSDLHDFEDTAALVTNLDLVISVDTSVAHLAGALAKPIWVLSRFDGCWRWLIGREDSPWYPTARLFRQKAPGAWDEVIERIAAELVKLSDASAAARAIDPSLLGCSAER